MHIILIQWNFNFLFPQIQNYFSQNYSINFKLNGDIKIKILPFPKVSITNIKYSNDDGITEIIIPKVQMKINLLNVLLCQTDASYHKSGFGASKPLYYLN